MHKVTNREVKKNYEIYLALACCDRSLAGQRDRALLLFAFTRGGRRRSEVTSATLENTRRLPDGSYVVSLLASKTNQGGVDRAENKKPITAVRRGPSTPSSPAVASNQVRNSGGCAAAAWSESRCLLRRCVTSSKGAEEWQG